MTQPILLAQAGRFVILIHDHPDLHWDFMLEAGGSLKTWRLAEEPRVGRPVAATAIPDHRIEYLDYEGPVSGDRGVVKRFDSGTYRRATGSDALEIRLSGRRIVARVRLSASHIEFYPVEDAL